MVYKKAVKFSNRIIDINSPTIVIAEIGQAHDGSLGTAHAYIDAVARAGVDAVKFQTHIASSESSPDEKFRVKCFPQDNTRYEYWKRMEFSFVQWKELSQHAEECGLIFLSTPFSFDAVDLLEEVGMVAWKVASGELTNIPLIEKLTKTGRPIFLSTGIASWVMLDEAVDLIREYENDLVIFQCTTAYPCPPEKIGLNVIGELRERYVCPVGLSDHSGTIYSSLAAVTLGAKLIEVHTVFSKECFGPDVSSSITTSELADLVRGIRFIESAITSPIDKNEMASELGGLVLLFGKSLYAGQDLTEGHVLSNKDIVLKKPGTGIPAKCLKEFIGKRLRRAYLKDEQFQESDLYGP